MKVIRGIQKFIKGVSVFDGYFLVAMMLMIGVDIVMRLFGSGIKGSVEIVTACVPVIVFLGVGYTALQEMHIRVDVVKCTYFDRVLNVVCLVALAIVGYHVVLHGLQVKSLGTSSTLLSIPRWPIVMVTAFGMFMTSLAMLLNEILYYVNLVKAKKNKQPAEAEAQAE